VSRSRDLIAVALFAMAACATGGPTQATRVVQPTAGRAIELTVGEQVRIDPPDASRRWALTGGDDILTIAPSPDDPPTHWTVTARHAGEVELAFEAPPPPDGRPAVPRIPFVVRVRPAP
jgi:hypothetical protein